jgi:predicted alpha/beta superfamily hydrolase
MKRENKIYFILLCGLFTLHFSPSLYAQSFDSIPVTNRQQILLSSKALNEDRTIWIHLPPDYNSSTDNYPVLYLLDGGSHFKYVSEMVDFLSDFETPYIPRMIVVGIPNIDRGRDFTPIFYLKAGKENGAERFLNFIQKELVPYIDKSYRAQPYRVLEAHSLGGLFGVYANAAAPNLFQASIIISPALTGDENKVKVMKDFAADLLNSNNHPRKFFITIGDEGTGSVDLLNKELTAFGPKSVQWKLKKYNDEDHFSVPYKSMYDGLRFIYTNWYMSVFLNPAKISYQDIEKHYLKLSEEFGYEINPSEDFLNQSGYQQLKFKHIEEAITIFKQNIKAHPNSFNVYDSMGEAYMMNGQKVLAIENYEKSIAINPDNENGKTMLKKLKGDK